MRLPFFVCWKNHPWFFQPRSAKNVIELHGSLFSTICSGCAGPHPHLTGEVPFPSQCQRCGGLLRPGVVWFGEAVERIGDAAQEIHDCQVFVVVGASAIVQPVASLAHLARKQGAFVAEINIEPTPLTEMVDLSLVGPAGELLPRVADAIAKG